MGDPEGLNTHAHSEQPQPLKRGSSIHTSLRRIAPSRPRDLVRSCSCEGVRSIGFFERNCEYKNRSGPRFCTNRHSLNAYQTRTEYDRVLKITDSQGLLSVGYPTPANLLSQSEVILELLNDAVALTGGFFEFPAVHNLHCTARVFYDSLFLQY